MARNPEPGVSLEKIAADFGIHPITLSTWLNNADIEDGLKPDVTSAASAELREAKKRSRLLAQEDLFLLQATEFSFRKKFNPIPMPTLNVRLR